jgi:hypothetical protein
VLRFFVMRIRICMFLFDCVSCVYIDMYLGVCACMYVCMSVRVCLCVGPFVCECVYVCMVVLARYTHTYKSIYLPTHDYIPTVPIHACLHVYTQYTNTTKPRTNLRYTNTHTLSHTHALTPCTNHRCLTTASAGHFEGIPSGGCKWRWAPQHGGSGSRVCAGESTS